MQAYSDLHAAKSVPAGKRPPAGPRGDVRTDDRARPSQRLITAARDSNASVSGEFRDGAGFRHRSSLDHNRRFGRAVPCQSIRSLFIERCFRMVIRRTAQLGKADQRPPEAAPGNAAPKRQAWLRCPGERATPPTQLNAIGVPVSGRSGGSRQFGPSLNLSHAA
jgi:hypothetical protein